MARKKSKEPDEGACPECRKSVPLVAGDQGAFVLRTHHVVIADPHYHGHGVEECGGSGGEPATLDDSEDWAWVPPFENGGLPGAQDPAAMRTVDGDSPVPLGEAIRAATAEIISADVRDERHVLTTQQMAEVMRQSIRPGALIPASTVPRELRPSYAEANGVDITDMISGPIRINYEPDFTGVVLVAMREAWIEVTGSPPSDATVTLEPEPFGSDTRMLTVRFQPYGLHASVPFSDHVTNDPLLAASVGREAGDTIRRLLRERLETHCMAASGAHERDERTQPLHEHRCRVCGWRWRDPVTAPPFGYINGA